MRLATLIISLVLMVIAGLQSCAAMVGGTVVEEYGTATDRQELGDLAAAGAAGMLACLLWLVAAAFVIARPMVSVWAFAVSAFVWLGAGMAGFADAYFWMFASLIFVLMSWRGVVEVERRAHVSA